MCIRDSLIIPQIVKFLFDHSHSFAPDQPSIQTQASQKNRDNPKNSLNPLNDPSDNPLAIINCIAVLFDTSIKIFIAEFLNTPQHAFMHYD